MNSFLHVNDLTKNEFEQIMNSSKIIKDKFKNDEKFHPLFNKTMAMIFAKPSFEQEYHLRWLLDWVDTLYF